MSFLESEAVCPYYIYDKNRVIRCEMANIVVRDKEMMKDIGYKLCGNMSAYCPFRKALDDYYKRKES